MRVYDSPLCLVAAHLASGSAEGDEVRRNMDYTEIVRRCAFPAQAEYSVDTRTLLSECTPCVAMKPPAA